MTIRLPIIENNGAADPTFAAVTIATADDGPRDVFVADIDGDGDMDIVAASDDDTIAWYENQWSSRSYIYCS